MYNDEPLVKLCLPCRRKYLIVLKHEERSALRKSGSFGSIYKLGPWIDENGLLRVGGRLQNAPIGYDQKHQLILPNRHKLIELIVREEHELSGHVSKEHILSRLRRSYWIVKGEQLSRE